MPRSTTANPNPRACLSCRGKHLKCNAKQPICDRCTSNQLECVYVRSKRGYVGGRGRQTNHQLASPEQSSEHQSCARGPISISTASTSPPPLADDLSRSPMRSSNSDDHAKIQALSAVQDDRLVHLYYQYVHPAHPFLIPHRLLRQNPDIIPTYLKHAIQFAARPLCESRPWDANEFQSIFDACSTPDGFQVQTLLLLTIAAYAHGQRVQGDKAIRQASETADQIGLDSDDFDNGSGSVLRESWRRTWWELYSICGMLRVLTPTMPSLQTPYNRLTPCHDAAYNSCQPTLSRNLDQMQERHFAEDHFRYSSFAYRIDAVRILNEVLDFASQDSQEVQSSSAFDMHRAAIRSYMLSLPLSYRNIVDFTGTTDELMFCALATINLASILLNLPRSSLSTTHSFSTICQTKRASVFTFDNSCTSTAIGAADSIVKLLIDRSTESMQSISPCFSCVLTFAATVHLLAYRRAQDQERIRGLREYFQVSLGALNSISQVWPIAKITKGQLSEFAREMFTASTTTSSSILARHKDMNMANLPEPILNPWDDQWLQEFVDTDFSFYTPA